MLTPQWETIIVIVVSSAPFSPIRDDSVIKIGIRNGYRCFNSRENERLEHAVCVFEKESNLNFQVIFSRLFYSEKSYNIECPLSVTANRATKILFSPVLIHQNWSIHPRTIQQCSVRF